MAGEVAETVRSAACKLPLDSRVANLAEELAKALTTLSFEIKTEVRFIPNDSRLGASPDVRSRVRVKRKGDSDRPSRASQPPGPRSEPPPDADPPPASEPD